MTGGADGRRNVTVTFSERFLFRSGEDHIVIDIELVRAPGAEGGLEMHYVTKQAQPISGTLATIVPVSQSD
jgi:hypothetical protein